MSTPPSRYEPNAFIDPAGLAELAQVLAQRPAFWFTLQQRLMQEHWALIMQMFLPAPAEKPAQGGSGVTDRRFAAPEWEQHPWFRWLRDAYLVNSRAVLDAIDAADLTPEQCQKLVFYTRLATEAMSPANFPHTNPEAIQSAIDTHGESLVAGARHVMKDIGRGFVSLTDETHFEIGRNIAATEGEVIFENKLMQLIHYRPLTPTVHQRPLLFIPPFVNKFYLMDLEPENSFVRWTVEQGHQLFLTSFKNATKRERDLTWDDYVTDGVIKAMEVVREVSGQADLNLLAFCTGGTLAATAFAPLAASGRRNWVQSVTLLAAGLDFTDVGEIGVYMDSPFMRQKAASLRNGGVMPAQELAAAFTALKANDLVWGNVVNHYLKGKPHAPFGLLYWNSDPTSLPGPMYAWYLAHTYLGNRLVQPNGAIVCGRPVDLRSIDLPTYAVAAIEDHIVPWGGAYESARMLGNNVRFCLTGGGHIAGTMNPASKNRRNYWINARSDLPQRADEWHSGAQSHKGSWWNDWGQWVGAIAGPQIAAPEHLGSARYAPIEPAPGRFVRERSV